MLSKRVEDYLEAIYAITERKGFARTKDIAQELNVKPPSVTEMVKKLGEMGFVEYKKHDGLTFTQNGRETAKAIKLRHDTFKDFLEIILIPKEIAEKDACEIEHHLSPKTVEQFTRFVGFAAKKENRTNFLKSFNEYCNQLDEKTA